LCKYNCPFLPEYKFEFKVTKYSAAKLYDPASINTSGLTFVASGPSNFATYIIANYPLWVGGIVYTGDSSTIISPPFPAASIANTRAFKSASSKQLSVSFLDHSGRKCGIFTKPELAVDIAERVYDAVDYTTAINWSLSNMQALLDIPDWSFYVSINITDCLRTRFFLQSRVKNLTYATKDAAGAYVFNTSAFASTSNGIGIDISGLNSQSMGYVFTEGDLLKLYIGASTVYTLRITAQSGNWLVCQMLNLGTIGDTATPFTAALFEIYTPYKASSSEPYYEIAQIFKINNPGTSSRSYSTLAGSIPGDIHLLERNNGAVDYLTENMSPSDTYYKVWNTDSGRPNFIDTIGQQVKKDTYSYSNTFIEGAKSNGLSTFDALDTGTVPEECGAISKLQLTSKVQNEPGVVMLTICEKETVSMYLGETQVVAAASNTFIAQSTDVVGTKNVLKGSSGTRHPESVAAYRGLVFWWDDVNARYTQYSVNGLDFISNYRMTRFWKLFTDQFNSMSEAQIEALGSRPYVVTTVDPHHGELLITIPKLLDTPPKGYLIDYPSTIYPFDIYDGQAKTIVFKLDMAGAEPYWMGAYAFTPEWLTSLQNELYTWKNGIMWQHNQANYNEFYGVQYKSRVMVVANANPNIIKVYQAFSLEVNMIPTLTYFASDTPYTQCTDIMDYEYRNWEGLYYAIIKRNKILPNQAGYTDTNILTGERMRSYIMYCLLEFTVGNNLPLELRFVNFNYDLSRGGTTT